jgi:hypothetical protein
MFAVLPSVGDALFAEHLNVVIETDQVEMNFAR